MMEWQKLLVKRRLGKQEAESEETARTCFQQDYDRIVFSSPFRRLQDKTQVFSLAKNDYVRTRLTHSIEVSCVGRSLGTQVGYIIIQRNNNQLQEFNPSDFGNIVSAACLAHDIGNPPFGHAGEDAIANSFKSWFDRNKQTLNLTNNQKTDFEQFEGNAQGFRILTRLEMSNREGGMQLTYPTLATFIKYPKESTDLDSQYEGISVKKYGFFQSEKDLLKQVAENVGLIKRSSKPEIDWYARHPLAFLVEAADDICYGIVDLEDGYRMGFIAFETAKALLNNIAKCSEEKIKSKAKDEEGKIKFLRAIAINKLVKNAAEVFINNEQDILRGKFDKELLKETKYNSELHYIKQAAKNKIINTSQVASIEIAGYEIINYLFSEFANSIFRNNQKDKKIMAILPQEYRPDKDDSDYNKILKITDYISGMTDSYAVNLFQSLKGISLKPIISY